MKKQITKKTANEEPLIIKISTDGCGGNPYFSITADLYEKGKPLTDRNCIACGCLHEEILAVAPELKPFVDLHLSTLEGVPMHAVENGFYWLRKAAGLPQEYAPDQDAETCFSYLCGHLRVDLTEANKIIGEVVNKYIDGKAKIEISEPVTRKCLEIQTKQGICDAKNHFKKIVDSMKPRWQNEAAQAIKQLEKLP